MQPLLKFPLFVVLLFICSCDFQVREASYTREQFGSDSTMITHYMLDSLSNDSLYISLGFKLVKCDAAAGGRLIEHNYKSTGEVMPPVYQKYFLLNSNGTTERIMTEDEFLGLLYSTKSYSIVTEPYE